MLCRQENGKAVFPKHLGKKVFLCVWSYVKVVYLHAHEYTMYVCIGLRIVCVCVGKLLSISVYDYSLSPSLHEH